MPDDVSCPDPNEAVTRAILREELAKELAKELANYPTKQDLQEALARCATNEKLDLFIGATAARFMSIEAQLQEVMEILKQIPAEFARHARSISEDFTRQIQVVDEKYDDLPRRVAVLEASEK
jgi:hypothetical protein